MGSRLLTMSSTCLGQLLLIILARLVRADCECGYSIKDPKSDLEFYTFTDVIETDFTRMDDMMQNSDWVPTSYEVSAEKGRGEYGKIFDKENVVHRREGSEEDPQPPEDAARGLELVVDQELVDGHVPGAEIDTARLDIHWGSFRVGMRTTDVNGTCAAFFWYFNDTQEIDMEFLSREFIPDQDHYPLSLVIQSEESKRAGYDASKTGSYQKHYLTFNPGDSFHEYRFDYIPGRVLFYVDGELVAEMDGDEVPSVGGHLILQHWSNGNPLWSGGPPKEQAVMSVAYVKAYFNSSRTEELMKKDGRCNLARSAGMDQENVCAIPEEPGGKGFFMDPEELTDGAEGSCGDGNPGTYNPHDETDLGDENEDDATRLRLDQPIALVMALVGAMLLVQA